MSKARVILHIIYVHGFQGDHTTFQSFPTDLHHVLQPQLPDHFELRSILYPTYKSKRPIAVATQNFLKWLDTLPSGPVILCGHSMGGLLTAEAATSPHDASKRVIALLAFDVPFLGMHPHVVISGIASLLPNKKGDSTEHGSEHDRLQGGGLKSEREMNDARHVDVPENGSSRTSSPNASSTTFPPPTPTSPTPGSASAPSLAPPSLPPRPSSSNQTLSAHHRSPSPPAFISRTMDLIQSHADDPLVRFLTKHKSEPLAAAKRWVIESFEFGICMFEPNALRERYATLEKWQGEWVAFWTETVPKVGDAEADKEVGEGNERVSKGDGETKEREATESLGKLLEPSASTTTSAESRNGSRSPSPPLSSSPPSSPGPASPPSSHGPPTKSEHKAAAKDAKAAAKEREKEAKALRKQQDKELKALKKQHKPGTPHHFVVRPFRAPSVPSHRWEQVKIRGAKDEVEAHCGLFLRDVNWEYEAFVERVAGVARGWAVRFDGR